MFYDDNATVSSCGKLFKKSLFDDIKFPKGRIYEDLAIVAKYIDKSNTVIISRNKAYKYYKREGSIVNSKFSDKRFDFYSAIEENRNIFPKDFDRMFKWLNDRNVMSNYKDIDFLERAFEGLARNIRKGEILNLATTELKKNYNLCPYKFYNYYKGNNLKI